MLGHMELGQLKHFLAVIDAGSVGDAARHLGMSQGAMSNSIRALEKSLNASLFERSPRGMRLTFAGESLEARARIIAAEVNGATEEIDLLGQGLKGRIAVVIGASTSHVLLPRAIKRFYRTHPQVQLSVAATSFSGVVSRLEAGEFDFGIFMLAGRAYRSLAAEPLVRRNRVLVLTSAENPRDFGRRAPLKDIAAGPWILNRDHSGLHKAFADAFQKAGLPSPLPAIEIDAGILPLDVVRANPEFLFIAPELFCRDALTSGQLKIVPARIPGFDRQLCAYYRKGSTLSPVARSFLKIIHQVASDVLGARGR
jgi:DNA-binding transcriptional LysR family regulator